MTDCRVGLLKNPGFYPVIAGCIVTFVLIAPYKYSTTTTTTVIIITIFIDNFSRNSLINC